MYIKITSFTIILLVVTGCNKEKKTSVKFSNEIRLTGTGSYLGGVKSGNWSYLVDNFTKEVVWEINQIDSAGLKLILPSAYRLMENEKAIILAKDSVTKSSFVIVRNDLSITKSLTYYESVVRHKISLQSKAGEGEEYFLSGDFLHEKDSVKYGFCIVQEPDDTYGFIFLFRKTKESIIDYSYKYPINSNEEWQQAIFWEIVSSIQGRRDLEFDQDKVSINE